MKQQFPEKYRIRAGRAATLPLTRYGAFTFWYQGIEYYALVADGEETGWEHVSVSVRNGKPGVLPKWDAMCYVKSLFWNDEEVVMQLHPRKSEYVDNADVLHLWRPINAEIPTPDLRMV